MALYIFFIIMLRCCEDRKAWGRWGKAKIGTNYFSGVMYDSKIGKIVSKCDAKIVKNIWNCECWQFLFKTLSHHWTNIKVLKGEYLSASNW